MAVWRRWWFAAAVAVMRMAAAEDDDELMTNIEAIADGHTVCVEDEDAIFVIDRSVSITKDGWNTYVMYKHIQRVWCFTLHLHEVRLYIITSICKKLY